MCKNNVTFGCMDSKQINNLLITNFKHEPTSYQSDFFKKFSRFLADDSQRIFVLKGFAGTGKTSIVKTVISSLTILKKNYVLIAPTGRAAKVLTKYTEKDAFTIHKKIYWTESEKGIFFNFKVSKTRYL